MTIIELVFRYLLTKLHSLGPDFDPNAMCLAFDTHHGRADLSLPDRTKLILSYPSTRSLIASNLIDDESCRRREGHPVSEDGIVVPRETTLRQIIASARLPKDDPPPFEDWREKPSVRNRDFHEDARSSRVLVDSLEFGLSQRTGGIRNEHLSA